MTNRRGVDYYFPMDGMKRIADARPTDRLLARAEPSAAFPKLQLALIPPRGA
ncbi:MAG: hypothetical protein WD557_19960 [Dehalococcoidia bacterium]